MDCFGLPHEIALLKYLKHNDALVVLSAGVNQYELAAAFLAEWIYSSWISQARPLIVCLGIYNNEETQTLKSYCAKYPILDYFGGITFLGNELSGKERRSLLAQGGIYTAPQQTWVIDLLQYRLVGNLVNALIVLNAHTSRLPYVVKAFVPDPSCLTYSMVGMEKTIGLLGLLLKHSESNIVLCPRTAPKLIKCIDPLLSQYLSSQQNLNSLSTETRIIQEALTRINEKAAKQTSNAPDKLISEQLSESLLDSSATAFLRNFLFLRYSAEKANEKDVEWYRSTEADLIVHASLDRIVKIANGESVPLEMFPRLKPIVEFLEGLTDNSCRVLICVKSKDIGTQVIRYLEEGKTKMIAQEIHKLALIAQSEDYFPASIRDTLKTLYEGLADDVGVCTEAQSSATDNIIRFSDNVELVITEKDDISKSILMFRPSHIVLSCFSVAWLRQVQIAIARMHCCVQWAFQTDSVPVKQEHSNNKDIGKPFECARIPVDANTGQLIKLEPQDFVDQTDQTLEDIGISQFRAVIKQRCATLDEARSWLHLGKTNCFMMGYESEYQSFRDALAAEKTAWESLAVQRSGLFVVQQNNHAEIFDTLPSEAEKIAYLLALTAGEGGDEISLSTRRGGGGVASLLHSLRGQVLMPTPSQPTNDEPLTRNQRRRLECNAIHDLLNKPGAEIVEALKTLVLVDIREMRSSLPFDLWRSGIKVLPMTLATADYILTRKIGVERKSLHDLSQSLANGRLLSQALRLTAQFELPALLIELYGNRFVQASLDSNKSVNDVMLLARLSCLTLGFPTLRLLWTPSGTFTAELFKVLKRYQPDPTMADGRRRTTITGKAVFRCAANAQNRAAADSLVYLPGFQSITCDNAVSHFPTLRDLILADEDALVEHLGREAGRELHAFANRVF